MYQVSVIMLLFHPNYAHHQRNAIDFADGKVEGLVDGIVGVDADAAFLVRWLDSLDECSLRGVDEVSLSPLKPESVEWHTLASHDVA
jgi:hypothetical protein